MGEPNPSVEQSAVHAAGDWNWHVWREAESGLGPTWLGFFKDTEEALDWIKTQPGHCAYSVNNKPPPTSRTFMDRTVQAAPRVAVKKATARLTFSGAKPLAPEVRAAMKDLKVDAVTEVKRHREDEAADIAAGKTESV